MILAAAIRTLLRLRNGDCGTSPSRHGQPLAQPALCWVAAQERNPATWAAFCREFERVKRTADGMPVSNGVSNDLPSGEDVTLWLDEIEATPTVSAMVAQGESLTQPDQQAKADKRIAIKSEEATEGTLRIVRIGTWGSLFGPGAEQ